MKLEHTVSILWEDGGQILSNIGTHLLTTWCYNSWNHNIHISKYRHV
jgi:hypothetical protein